MSETAENVLLSSLSSISNTFNNNGPSFNFHSNISTEELLTVRTPPMQKFLRENVTKYHTEGGYVLDAGCGSGKDSALLISNGFQNLVSCDLSDGMVSLAKRNKAAFLEQEKTDYSKWEIFEASLVTLKEQIVSKPELPQQYDNILCIGNTLPFILDKKDAFESMKSFAGLLRSGGALIIDHRNFHPMINKGKVNKNGFNPCTLEKFNNLNDIIPHVIKSPGEERKPLVAFLEFQRGDGIKMYFSYRIYTPETMTEIAKQTFGPDVKVEVFFDLKPPSESPEEDACWVTYVITKP